MKFEELNLHPEVLKGIANAGFTDCTEVQASVCPVSLQGRDIMARSKTGSGKTAVFLITILERLMKDREAGKSPKALIVSPTRELALQIAADAEVLCSGMENVHVTCFYGGVGYESQKKAINEGVDIYVGTPGRLIDFMKSHQIDFHNFSSFVVDEADRMFDMGFYPDIQQIFAALPDKTQRQTMMFSATLSTKVRNLAWNYMNNPEEIELEPEEVTVAEISQELYHTTRSEKFKLLLLLLKREDPSAVLIFSNTKYMTVDVSERLKLNGYTAVCLMGDMPQEKRQKALEKMKKGEVKVLVATDVAARGLQIDDLPLVVNYDIPEDYESYVHRVGRTARAGKKGKAITLADEEYVWGLEPIENYIHMKLPVMWADGIEDVEDLSAGKKINNREHLSGVTSSFRRGGSRSPSRGTSRGPRPSYGDGRDSRGQGRSSSRSNPRSQQGPNAVRRNDSNRRYSEKRGTDGLDDSKLSKMTSDERMAYYKKAFYAEDSSERKDTRQNRQGTQTPRQGAPKQESKGTNTRRNTNPKPAGAPKQNNSKASGQKPQNPKTYQKPQAAKSEKSVSKDAPKSGLKGFFHKLFGKKG